MLDSRQGGSCCSFYFLLFPFFLFQLLCKKQYTINIKYNCKHHKSSVYNLVVFYSIFFFIEGFCSSAINLYKSRWEVKWPCCSLCSTKAEDGVCWGGPWAVKVSHFEKWKWGVKTRWKLRGARSVCCSSFWCMSSTEDRKQLVIITKLSKHPIPLIFSLKCNRQIKSRLSLERNEMIPVGIGQVSLCPVAVPELVCGHQSKEQWFLRV